MTQRVHILVAVLLAAGYAGCASGGARKDAGPLARTDLGPAANAPDGSTAPDGGSPGTEAGTALDLGQPIELPDLGGSTDDTGPTTSPPDDLGPGAPDLGQPDLGPGAPDLGPTGTDSGPAPIDLGPPRVDSGPAPVDMGPPRVDSGPPPVDMGPPPVDMGPPAVNCATSADCTPCGGGSYCAGRACVANPTALTYGLDNALPTGWTNGVGGTAAWTFDTSTPRVGSHRMRSGSIGANGQSRLSFTVTLANAASISFTYGTSSEACCDKLRFFIDGAEVGNWGGTLGATQAGFSVAAGAHTFEWRYSKDGSINTGSDLAWIDEVQIGPFLSPNTGFETGIPTGYTTSGAATWRSVATMPRSGSACAQSGAISDSSTTILSRTVSAATATTLTFWYRVSSEPNYDYLELYVDGSRISQWAGNVGWTQATQPLAAGTHTVEWRYRKDFSNSIGSDAAWIDDVDFGLPAPPAMVLCGP